MIDVHNVLSLSLERPVRRTYNLFEKFVKTSKPLASAAATLCEKRCLLAAVRTIFFPRGLKHHAPHRWLTSLATTRSKPLISAAATLCKRKVPTCSGPNSLVYGQSCSDFDCDLFINSLPFSDNDFFQRLRGVAVLRSRGHHVSGTQHWFGPDSSKEKFSLARLCSFIMNQNLPAFRGTM